MANKLTQNKGFFIFYWGFGVRWMFNPPVHSYGRHGVDAGEHRCDGEEVVEFAVGFTKVPLPVRGIDEVDQGIERRHGRVRKSQVEQKVIGHSAHPLVGQNDPDNDEVSEHGHGQHRAVGDRPEGHAPRRLHELVGVVRCEVGPVVLRSFHPPLLCSCSQGSEALCFYLTAVEAQSWRGFVHWSHCAQVERT